METVTVKCNNFLIFCNPSQDPEHKGCMLIPKAKVLPRRDSIATGLFLNLVHEVTSWEWYEGIKCNSYIPNKTKTRFEERGNLLNGPLDRKFFESQCLSRSTLLTSPSTCLSQCAQWSGCYSSLFRIKELAKHMSYHQRHYVWVIIIVSITFLLCLIGMLSLFSFLKIFHSLLFSLAPQSSVLPCHLNFQRFHGSDRHDNN